MKIYTVIAGVNGCGKSSLTGALKSERSDLGMLVDVDKLAVKFSSPLLGAKEGIKTIENCLNNGYSITQETTLSGVKTEKTIKRAKNLGYNIRLYYIGLDTAEDSILRIKNRVSKGGHNIPTADVLNRFENRFIDLLKILPYCDTAIFFDNDNGFIEVAEYKNGEFILNSNGDKKWVKTLNELLK
ncbi:MAG: zeta toxin family protein [Clostridia bacterium]